ncbi:hypothetical protein OU682_12220 [Paracoccus sp. EF6]|uniref:Uncharacterized protein n=1 Tax=Paracoccus benzoatiresistens TaxID=2997341 RepID=A0ABT4J5L5_9RHOB|nr:hypothetical protein [Paracoccus sp. EF6]MCZ0962384.1 hypothetical protein [Paracoccus sp. EF6]
MAGVDACQNLPKAAIARSSKGAASRLSDLMAGAGTTAFVLAGGGSLGVVQVGMLPAMTKAGLRPDFVIMRLIGAVLFEQNDEWQTSSRYMMAEASAQVDKEEIDPIFSITIKAV